MSRQWSFQVCALERLQILFGTVFVDELMKRVFLRKWG